MKVGSMLRISAIAFIALVAASSCANAQTGSVKTQTQLNNEINSFFPDQNPGAGLINPFNTRQTLLDMVASTSSAMASGTSCTGLTQFQFFANTTSAPTDVVLDIYDGTQCVPWAILNETAHTFVLTSNINVIGDIQYGARSPGIPSLMTTGELYYDSTNNFSEHDSALNLVVDLGAGAPPGVVPTMTNFTECRGDNATFIGCAGFNVTVQDRSSVTSLNKGILYGELFNIIPSVARNNSPFDDADAIVIQNAGTAKATDAIYVGQGSNLSGHQWATLIALNAQADTMLLSNGTYTNAIDISLATISGDEIKAVGLVINSGGQITSGSVSGMVGGLTLLGTTSGSAVLNVNSTGQLSVTASVGKTFFEPQGGSSATLNLQGTTSGTLTMGVSGTGGHLTYATSGAAPTANSCTGFALTTGSTDTAGQVSYNSATTCSITFGTAFTNTPFCVVSPGTAVSTVEAASSTSGLAVTFGSAQTAFQYVCYGS